MPILRFQVRIPALSGVTADDVVNTFHFSTTGTTEGLLAEIKASLVDFYEALDAYKSVDFTWNAARVKVYNLDDAEPRVPIDDTGLALTSAPAGASGAHELALCISFKAEYVSGSSAARRRGRIFFGPLTAASVTTNGRPLAALITAAVTAGGGLLTDSNTASDWAWVVWSPTSGQGYPVVEGWVDNEFDIQRRRGTKATTRSTF